MSRAALFLWLLALAPAACDAGPSPGEATPAGSAAPASSGPRAASANEEWTAHAPEVMSAFQAQAASSLAADVRARTDAARRRFGDDVPVRVLSGTFVLVAADLRAPLGPAADLAQQALDVYLARFFARRPDRAVTVYVASSEPRYEALCDQLFPMGCDTEGASLGAYDARTRSIVVNLGPGLPTITHEIVHPFIQTDFPWAPAWIDEGIASLFEKPVFSPPGEMHGERNWRYDDLSRALASPSQRGKVRLSALFSMLDSNFRGYPDEELHYATARFVCQWLDDHGQLWPFYRAWRDGYRDDPSGEKTFTKVVGMTPAQADAPWLEWLRHLR